MNIKPKSIPKFLNGSNLWYQNLIDYDPSKYIYNYDTSTLVDGDMSDQVFDPWVSKSAGFDKGRYVPTTGHGAFGVGREHFNYTKGVEEQNYYKKFGQDLLDANGNFTEMGRQWAKAVDALIPPSNHLARFYDTNGNLRTQWTTSHNDAHNRAPRTYNNLREYVEKVRNDQILGARHNVFLNRGKRYFYKDQNGVEHWVDPNQIGNYIVSQKPVRSNWNNDHTIYWDDYELTGLANTLSNDNIVEKEETSENIINATHQNQYGFDWKKLGNNLQTALPGLLATGRLAGNIWNNNRVYNEILKGIRPDLRQTYNTYRPIVGDEATKQAYYRRAAHGQTRAAQPFTSDADRQMAYQMEAKRIGDELRAQGDLADNQMIQRTSDESNQHQWANTQRATEIANANIASINAANREKHNLIAQKYSANWTSFDNYLKGIEYRARQKQAENQAINDRIWELENSLALQNDEELIKARQDAQKALQVGGYDRNNSDYISKKKIYDELLKQRQIEYYEKLRNRTPFWNVFMAKNGVKITHKKKDDLLYKSTRDAVEHFRKMSKLTADVLNKRKTKIEKLTSHPKGNTRKYQQGGVAPFTIYTPVALGGETSTQVTSGGTNTKSSDKKKDPIDIIKDLFGNLKGLPIDVNSAYQGMQNFLLMQSEFGEGEIDSSDLASMYLSQLQNINNIAFSKELYDKSKAQATQNDALYEFAVTTNGNFIVQKDGKITEVTLADIKANPSINPLTNNDLLMLRAYDPRMMLERGDYLMETVVSNGIGLGKIADKIKSWLPSIGTDKITQEGYTKHQAGEIKAGLELLREAPDGDYTFANHTEDQRKQMKAALSYMYGVMPRNYKAVLEINAMKQGVSTDFLLAQLMGTTSYVYSQTFNAVTGKAAKATRDANEGDDGLKLDAPTALISGKGYQDNIEFNPGTSYAVTVNARHSGFQKKSGENMGNGITMQDATTSTLDQVLDWNKATLGGSRLNPTGYNRIMINNNDVVGVDLPVGQDKTKPDFTMLQKLQLLDQELLKRGIEDTSNNWQQVNQICQEIGLPSKYKSDGHLNDYSWNRFAAFQVTADDSVLVNKDAILDDILGIVEDDNVRSQYEQIIQKDNKNYKLGSGFLGFGKQALYQGTVFVPIKSNLVGAALSGGQNITMSQATDLELRERGYDQSKAATYKPGMNFNEL